MASGPIDLTVMDSDDDDDDVKIMGSTMRQQSAKAFPPKKAMTPNGSIGTQQQPKTRATSAFTPHAENGQTIDLRHSPSPDRSKQTRQEPPSNGKQRPRTELVAQKSVLSGLQPAWRIYSATSFDVSDNDEPESLDMDSALQSRELTKPQLLKHRSSDALNGSGSALKRPLDSMSSSPASKRPIKKARFSGPFTNGKASSQEISATAKKVSTQPEVLSRSPSTLAKSVVRASGNNSSPSAANGKWSLLSYPERNSKGRTPSSPFGSQRSRNNVLPKSSGPIADLQASQEKRAANQQVSSQESGDRALNGPNGTSRRSAGQKSKRNSTGPHSPCKTEHKEAIETSDASRGGRPRENLQKFTQQSDEISSLRSLTDENLRTAPKKSPLLTSMPLTLLNQQSSVAEEPHSQDKRFSPPSPGHELACSDDGKTHEFGNSKGVSSLIEPSPEKVTAALSAATVNPASEFVKDASRPKGSDSQTTRPAHPGSDSLEQVVDPSKATNLKSGPSESMGKVPETLPPNDRATTKRAEKEATSRAEEVNPAHRSSISNKDGDAARRLADVQPGARSKGFKAAMEAAEADDQLQSEALRAQSETHFALPQSSASALKSTAAYAKMSLANKVERILCPYLDELAENNELWTSSALQRARQSQELAATEAEEQPTSFAHVKPLELTPALKNTSREQTWGIEKIANGKPVSTELVSVPRQTFTTHGHDVPSYAHYVSITNNLLAQNNKTLHCWPYFGDDFNYAQAENLKDRYHLDIQGREHKLLRLRQAQKYEEYVEDALADLGISWADVLRFLLEPRPVVGIDPYAIDALDKRQDFCREDFDRNSRRWVAVLSSLPPSSSDKLAIAAILCDTFQNHAHFPLWHIARRCDLCKLAESSEVEFKDHVASGELTCRICMLFNCPYHGELNERRDSEDEDGDDESDTSSVSVVATDLVHPPKINYRTRVAFPSADPMAEDTDEPISKVETKDLRYWQNFQNKADARGPFYPCYHPGKSCDDHDAHCSCHAQNLPCEKFCGCDNGCVRRFKGCACSTQRIRASKRGPCFDDERCPCWQLGRECDPDLCGGCGVCEVVDPINKHDEGVSHGRCQNASIQRAVPKCTILGDSGVHGLGLYACENIRAHEFVGEYKGEIITKEEAERRGAVYEHQKLSYLFSLNKDQEIDSTYFGNKIRFINHAGGSRANLYPRIIMVNTVHRIALYAQHAIRKGEELLFDYGPQFPDEQLGGKKSKKSAPHVRNANLVKEFYDVEADKDELGNVRAKKVASGAGGRRPKVGKARGGARPGAGRKPKKKDFEPQAEAGPSNYQQREESSFEDDFTGQDAGERLAAYNVSDDREQMDLDLGAGLDTAEDDDEEYEDSEVESSEESGEDRSSSESEESEVSGVTRRRPGRPRARTSWRTR